MLGHGKCVVQYTEYGNEEEQQLWDLMRPSKSQLYPEVCSYKTCTSIRVRLLYYISINIEHFLIYYMSMGSWKPTVNLTVNASERSSSPIMLCKLDHDV